MVKAKKIGYVLLNTTALVLLFNGLKGILANQLPRHLKEAGHFQFLTNLSLVVTIFALIIEILSIITSKFQTLSSYLLFVSLILETIVSSIYWTLKTFFLHLIINTKEFKTENFIPLELDLTIHLLPFLILSIDILFLNKPKQRKNKIVLFSIISFFTLSYWSLLEHLISNARLIYPGSEYPYAFLNFGFIPSLLIFLSVSVLGNLIGVLIEKIVL